MNVFLSIQVLKAAFNVETTMCRIAVSPISLYLAS